MTRVKIFILFCFFYFQFQADLKDYISADELIPRTRILTMGTGGTAGVYFPIGKLIASILRKSGDAVVLVQPTDGSLNNLSLLAQKRVDLALVQSDVLYNEIHSQSLNPLDLSTIRTLISLYSEHLYFVVSRKSGIKNWEEFEDKTISFGPEDSGTFHLLKPLLPKLGVDIDSLEPLFLNLKDSITALKKGKADGFFFVGGEIVESIKELGEQSEISILSIPFDVTQSIILEFPYLTSSTIPNRNYPFLPGSISTLSVRALILGAKELPDKLATAIIQKIYNKKYLFSRFLPGIKKFNLQQATLGTSIPFHKGVEDFLQRKNIHIPKKF
ncbi:TAXI family TRAP transporter solute-binding subunit [Candidatus Riflebacteria bacterium]